MKWENEYRQVSVQGTWESWSSELKKLPEEGGAQVSENELALESGGAR